MTITLTAEQVADVLGALTVLSDQDGMDMTEVAGLRKLAYEIKEQYEQQ